MVKGRVKDGVRGEKRNTVTASPRRKQLATAVPGGGSQSDHTDHKHSCDWISTRQQLDHSICRMWVALQDRSRSRTRVQSTSVIDTDSGHSRG